MRIVSWNVNGLRAVMGRGDLAWALGPDSDVDIVCLQETKIQPSAVTEAMQAPPGWRSFFTFGVKKGYSGTAVFVRDEIAACTLPFSVGGDVHPEFDSEGRVVAVDLGAVVLLNVYFPNGGSSDARLAFKHAWHEAFLAKVVALKAERSVVVVGDFNIAHRDIDLALPQKWQVHSGFLPVERAWFSRLLDAGFVDTFRAEKGDLPRQYTFWETRIDARNDNLGWRIDYVVASRDLEDKLTEAWIAAQVLGSDHCPVGAEFAVTLSRTHADAWALNDEPDDDDSDASGWRR